jgi:PTH1 family peptidyl-tRNA hydrolase
VLDYYKLTLKNVVVVHDELDVTFGQIRTRVGGGSAGNNGIKSVTQHVSENYGRIRIGIGPKTPEQMDSADFVLGKFSKEEQKNLPLLKREVQSILIEFIYRGELYPDTRSFII